MAAFMRFCLIHLCIPTPKSTKNTGFPINKNIINKTANHVDDLGGSAISGDVHRWIC
jgi:hypothetical protein